MRFIDLRSDTVTKPTPAMRQAMLEAEVGDDVFGEDPSVNLLQRQVAELLGKEEALFVPSGTMANEVALAANTSPGDEVYCETGCHIRNYEAGGPAALCGVSLNSIDGRRGAYTAEEVRLRLRSSDVHFPQSRLLWVENSANRAGGAIFPQAQILELRRLADEFSLSLHLDGARLWNVAAALNQSERELAKPFDSVSVCLSKGLGCPVGSLVAGAGEFIRRARRFRKRFGGGMRQAGLLAAAGLFALQHHRTRLGEDNRRARRLGEAIAGLDGFSIDLQGLQTNIVIFDTLRSGKSAESITNSLREHYGVLCFAFGSSIRMVTHLDVNDQDIQTTIEALRAIASEGKPRRRP